MPPGSRPSHTTLMLNPMTPAAPSSTSTPRAPSSLPSSTSSSPPQPQPPPQPPPQSLLQHSNHSQLEASSQISQSTCSPSILRPPNISLQPNVSSVNSIVTSSLSQISPTTPSSSLMTSPTSQSLQYPVLGNGLNVDAIFLRAERVFEQRVETLLHAKRCKALQSGAAFNARKAKRDARTVAGREKLDALVRRLADLAAAQHVLLSKQTQKVVSDALDGAAAAIIGLAALHTVPPSASPSSSSSVNHQPQQQQDVVTNDGSSCSDDSVQCLIPRQVTGSNNMPIENGRHYPQQNEQRFLANQHQQMFSATQSVVDYVLDYDEDTPAKNRLEQTQCHPFSITSSDDANSFTRKDDAHINSSNNQVRLGFGLGLDERKRLVSNYMGDDMSCISNVTTTSGSKLIANVNRNNYQSSSPLLQHHMSSSNLTSSPPPSNPSTSSLTSLASTSSVSASSSCASLSTSCLPTIVGTSHANSTQSFPSSTMASSYPSRGGYIHQQGNGFWRSSAVSNTGHGNGILDNNLGKNGPSQAHNNGRGLKRLNKENNRGKLNYSSSMPTGVENYGGNIYGYLGGLCSQAMMSSTLGVNSAGSYGSTKYLHIPTTEVKAVEGNTMKNELNNNLIEFNVSNGLNINRNMCARSDSSAPMYIDRKGDMNRFVSSYDEKRNEISVETEDSKGNNYDLTNSNGITNITYSSIVQQQKPQQQQQHYRQQQIIAHSSAHNLTGGANVDNRSIANLDMEGLSQSFMYSVSESDQVPNSCSAWQSQPPST